MPMPWTARAAISWPGFWARPATAEAATNRTSASCMSTFLLNRSAILPHSGVVAVMVSREAVTTQV